MKGWYIDRKALLTLPSLSTLIIWMIKLIQTARQVALSTATKELRINCRECQVVSCINPYSYLHVHVIMYIIHNYSNETWYFMSQTVNLIQNDLYYHWVTCVIWSLSDCPKGDWIRQVPLYLTAFVYTLYIVPWWKSIVFYFHTSQSVVQMSYSHTVLQKSLCNLDGKMTLGYLMIQAQPKF